MSDFIDAIKNTIELYAIQNYSEIQHGPMTTLILPQSEVVHYSAAEAVSLILFQHASEDLHHSAAETALLCHQSCFNMQVR